MVSPETIDVIDRALDERQYSYTNTKDIYSLPNNILYEGSQPDLIDLDMQDFGGVQNQPESLGIQDETFGSFVGQLLNEDCGTEPLCYMDIVEIQASYVSA